MVNMQKGSDYMGGVDRAAYTIQAILNEEICGIIDEALAEGVISMKRAANLKSDCQKFGATVANGAYALHGKLTTAAKKADLDVPPMSDGVDEFVEKMKAMATPRSGDR